MSPAEHLKAARALLEDPKKWTKGAFARDEYGHASPIEARESVAWCASGALRLASQRDRDLFWASRGHLAGAMELKAYSDLSEYNDRPSTTHQDLLAWFDRAIAHSPGGGTMTPLRQARELLTDPTKWCQGRFAADKHGRTVIMQGPEAVSWCALGVMYHLDVDRDSPAVKALRKAIEGPWESITDCNDNLNHAQLLAWFDRAIALAEAS